MKVAFYVIFAAVLVSWTEAKSKNLSWSFRDENDACADKTGTDCDAVKEYDECHTKDSKEKCPATCGYCGEDCKDIEDSSTCKIFVKDGCKDFKDHSSVYRDCRKTCGLCQGEKNDACADKSGVDCDAVKEKKKCHTSDSKENCPATCEYCEEDCKDIEDTTTCETHYVGNDCKNYKDYLIVYLKCRKSCGLCQGPKSKIEKNDVDGDAVKEQEHEEENDVCADQSGVDCDAVKQKKKCHTKDSKETCPATCEYCEEDCKDTKDICQRLYVSNGCKFDKDLPNVYRNCRKSCGLCQGPKSKV